MTSSVCPRASGNCARLKLIFDDLIATSAADPCAPGAGISIFESRDPEKQTDCNACIASAPQETAGFKSFLRSIAASLCDESEIPMTSAQGAVSIEMTPAIHHAAQPKKAVQLLLPRDYPSAGGWRP